MYIKDVAQKLWCKGIIKLQEKSPELLLGGGLVSIGLGVVDACRATLYADEIIEQHKKEIEEVRAIEAEEYANVEKAKKLAEENNRAYPEENLAIDLKRIELNTRKNITRVYLRSIGRFIKLYSRPVILIACGVLAITKSHDILSKRLTGAIAAYNVVSEQFNSYRDKVVNKYGKDIDTEMLYQDIKNDKVIDAVDENGNHVDPNSLDRMHEMNRLSHGYARYYQAADKHETVNQAITKILVARNLAQELLESRGYLLLNEVYSSLGIPETDAGMVVGWTLKDGGRSGGVVDFGINGLSFCKENMRHYADEFDHDRRILLDFNCDGVVYGKLQQAMAAM